MRYDQAVHLSVQVPTTMARRDFFHIQGRARQENFSDGCSFLADDPRRPDELPRASSLLRAALRLRPTYAAPPPQCMRLHILISPLPLPLLLPLPQLLPLRPCLQPCALLHLPLPRISFLLAIVFHAQVVVMKLMLGASMLVMVAVLVVVAVWGMTAVLRVMAP